LEPFGGTARFCFTQGLNAEEVRLVRRLFSALSFSPSDLTGLREKREALKIKAGG
jgi:hypothetical protein